MLTSAARKPRHLALAMVLLAPLALLFVTVGPSPQDPAYHALADRRTFFNVPNFLNVASNGGFLAIGLIGLHMWSTASPAPARHSWGVFFLGILLVAFGSACYHLNPGDAALVWDRLPMTIAFMGLFSALAVEKVAPRHERIIAPIALAIGIFSVLWWRYSNDLRLYAWVQFGPLLALVYMLIVYPARDRERVYLAWGFAFYAIAKLCEAADTAIFSATSGAISGHSLKHLFAALAPLCVYLMLRNRGR